MATQQKKKPLTKPNTRTTKKVASSATQHQVTIASVPDKRYADEYVSRSFSNHTEFDVFDMAMENLFNVLIEGPTGPGKTSAVLAYAANRGMRFYAVPSNIGIEPSQLFGKYVPGPLGNFVWQDGGVTDIVRNGGVLLVNEINFMPDRVSTVIFGLLDKRREITLLDHMAERIAAHRGGGKSGECWCEETAKVCDSKRVIVLADMNPEYEGTRPLNKALRNRFAIQLNWDYDDNVERQLVYSDALVDMAVALRNDAAKSVIETPVSTNMLQEFEQVFVELGYEFAATNFVQHFDSSEQASVLQTMKTYRANIEADYEEDAGDENWGVKGTDWAFEDEIDGGDN